MGVKWLKAIFFIAGLVLEGYETAGALGWSTSRAFCSKQTRELRAPARLAQPSSLLLWMEFKTTHAVKLLLRSFFFFFFPDVLTAPANTSPSAPEPRTAMKTRKWAEKAKHRFPICSLPAFSWAIIQLQICDYSWQGLFISWETFGTTQCFCRECQPPGERVFQIRFFFFLICK